MSSQSASAPSIALVHDSLSSFGGAERVLGVLHELYPTAPIFTIMADRAVVQKFFRGADVRTSGMGSDAWSMRRMLAPWMPSAIESFNLSGFDVVLSSSITFAKGIVVRPGTKHVCYCFSPSRPLWDRAHRYEYGARIRRHLARLWDTESSERVDAYAAISEHVQKRIEKYYRRTASVIYPPLIELPQPKKTTPFASPYFVIVSRLVLHKNIELAIDTFAKLGYQLVIIGDGPLRSKLAASAPRNCSFLGFVDDQTVATYLAHAQALIMPCEEDFGLTALEALSVGTPVLALRKGGALEIIQEGTTGEFFDDQIPEALADGIERLRRNRKGYDPETLRASTLPFCRERFSGEIHDFIYAA